MGGDGITLDYNNMLAPRLGGGHGIDPARLEAMAERFRAAHADAKARRESGGTGLGLSIVKHVLNLHQARFEIESEVNKGSTFACVFGAERVRDRA
jgi:signal transduction histidine kinase